MKLCIFVRYVQWSFILLIISCCITATDIIFISGPVVVSPSAKIQFQTVYPPTTNSAKGEWLIIKKNLSSKLQFGAPGYCIRTSGSKPTIQNIEITNPVENGSAFQLSVETTKSNIINIFVDGIFTLKFFLQELRNLKNSRNLLINYAIYLNKR